MSQWSDTAVLERVRNWVMARLGHKSQFYWILDDTGFPKKGTHSVGVARQYCGQLGKQDNCQVAVSLSLANDGGSLPVAFDLYLPEEWATDPVRRTKAGVPKTLAFRTKPQIALEQIRARAGRGPAARRRAGRCRLWRRDRLPHGADRRVLELCPGRAVRPWRLAAGMRSLAAQAGAGRGAGPSSSAADAEHQPVSAKDLAFTLPPSAWQTVSWREGSRGDLSGRFAAVRVRPSHRDIGGPSRIRRSGC